MRQYESLSIAFMKIFVNRSLIPLASIQHGSNRELSTERPERPFALVGSDRIKMPDTRA